MRYLLIENEGEIDANAFLLIGASTKTNQTEKIGEFGSGANYAIAWLLRNNVAFGVFSGERRIEFDTRKKNFRDEVFNAIVIDGQETSFTTQMGKKWKPWYVLREFWCNALDEGNERREILNFNPFGEQPKGEPGKTRIYIEVSEEIGEVLDNWDLYFSSHREDVLFEGEGFRVFRGSGELRVYRKGILVEQRKETATGFHIDFPAIDINESRVVSGDWELQNRMRYFWQKIAPVDLIREFLRLVANSELWERTELDFRYGTGFGDNWKLAIEGRPVVGDSELDDYGDIAKLNNAIVLPQNVARILIGTKQIEHVAGKYGELGIFPADPTEKERFVVEEAIRSLNATGYKIDFPIEFARFKTKGILGRAYNGKIYLCTEAIPNVFDAATTIVEENEHLKTGFQDETREFQQHWINEYVRFRLASQGISVTGAELTETPAEEDPFAFLS